MKPAHYTAIIRLLILLIALSCTLSSCSSKRRLAKKKKKANTTVVKKTETKKEPVKTTTSTTSKRETEINKVIGTAKSYWGTPHKMGGMSKSGIDCSGLMVMSYKSIEKVIPRTSNEQAQFGSLVKKEELQNGDLVFFTYPGGSRITHVGMVSKVASKTNVTFIHASSSKGVREDILFSDYWIKLFVTARRVY